ncbi:MAG: acetyl-CoA carboxylase biotin carboxyl carrier protein [Blastocatellia bacterium]
MKKTERKTKTTPVKSAGETAGPAETGSSSTSAENEAGEYLSLAEIKELIELISEKQFNEFELERGGFRLHTRKGPGKPAVEPSPPAPLPSPAGEIRPVEAAPPPQPQPAPPPQEEKLHVVAAPIVGTFYRSSSPTAEPFVKLGDAVENGKTLCIIEAMKLMNEIQSDAGGTVAKVFVENGQPVEYGQPLFGIKV